MKAKNIIKIIILAIILVLLLNPGILPFGASTVGAIKTQLSNHIGGVLGGKTGIFSLMNLIPALAAIVICWLVALLADFVLGMIQTKKARTRTVLSLTASIIKYACTLLAIVWALNIMGVNLTAIFASLGVLTLIIGFGAQSLIEDMVTGLFIILEGNYNVDDVIVLDDFRGTVQRIGLRTTTIMDTGGNLKIVNNSDIRNIQNRSKNLSLAVCDIGIEYEASIPEVEKIILPKLSGIYERNQKILRGVPRYMGVQELADSAVVLRIVADCEEPNIFAATRCLNREMKIMFDENGIGIPFPQVDIHSK